MSTTAGKTRRVSQKARVLLLLKDSLSDAESFVTNEFDALSDEYEIRPITRRHETLTTANDPATKFARATGELLEAVRTFEPDILHAHHLSEVPYLRRLAELTGIPFTVRTNSFETGALRLRGFTGRLLRMIKRSPPVEEMEWIAEALRALDSEFCLGVLTYPCTRPWLSRAGVSESKLIDCFPVVKHEKFHDQGPNGTAVMNGGAPYDRRALADYFHLALRTPGQQFSVYTMGYQKGWLEKRKERFGADMRLFDFVQPEHMPAEYKKHQWMVYTGGLERPILGWPLAIAEAQAAGVGVCMPNLRPDLASYVGEGAGVLFDSIDELPGIVSGPVPDEMRERGFEQSGKSDIARHKHLLTDLWDEAVRHSKPHCSAHAQTDTETEIDTNTDFDSIATSSASQG